MQRAVPIGLGHFDMDESTFGGFAFRQKQNRRRIAHHSDPAFAVMFGGASKNCRDVF